MDGIAFGLTAFFAVGLLIGVAYVSALFVVWLISEEEKD